MPPGYLVRVLSRDSPFQYLDFFQDDHQSEITPGRLRAFATDTEPNAVKGFVAFDSVSVANTRICPEVLDGFEEFGQPRRDVSQTLQGVGRQLVGWKIRECVKY
jgi:hypothetical protein